MQIHIEGTRATDQSWWTAMNAAVSQLPPLTEAEKQSVQRTSWSEKRYARSVYAGLLALPDLEEPVKGVGRLVQALVKECAGHAALLKLTFQTLQGVYQATAEIDGQRFHFSFREELLESVTMAGDAEALASLRRIIELAVLPFAKQLRVS